MSRAEILRKQHDAIVQLASEISEASGALATPLDAERTFKTFKRFDSILRTHLSSEDTFLYPAMIASSHHEAAETASRFKQEMGGLIWVYVSFAERWTSGESILAERSRFRMEWKALVAALARRIERENDELYPLADALEQDAQRKSA